MKKSLAPMWRFFCAFILAAGLVAPAHAQVNRSTLHSQNNTTVTGNGIGAITGTNLNQLLGNYIDSLASLQDPNSFTALQTFQVAPVFQGLTGVLYGNGSSAATALPLGTTTGTVAAGDDVRLSSPINVRASPYGAVNDGTTAAGSATQSAITAAKSIGAEVLIPRGKYRLNSPLTVDYAGTSGDSENDPRGVSVRGNGPQNTILLSDLPGSYAFNVLGNATGTAAALNYGPIGGFTVSPGPNNTGTPVGMYIFGSAFGTYDNIHLHGLTVGLKLESVLSSAFNRLMITGGVNGIVITKGTGFSDHNANKYNSAEFRLGTGFAVSGGDVTDMGFNNLTVQGWGTQGSGSAGGMDLTFTGNEGGTGLKVNSGYIEGNSGAADFRLTNNSATNTVVHTFTGVTFNRISSTGYVTNNIALSGTGKQVFICQGCHFYGYGTYVENVARPYIAYNPAIHKVICQGCVFGSAVAQNGVINEEDKQAGGSITSAGVANVLPSGWTSSRSSAGIYVITHNLGLTATNYEVTATANTTNSSAVQRVILGTNSFTIVVVNSGGTLTDEPVTFIMRRGG